MREMKTIPQLLELAKNPHYKFMADEQRALDGFLARKRDSRMKRSREQFSNESSEKTPVTVKNVVEKADTYAPDSRRVDSSRSDEKND